MISMFFAPVALALASSAGNTPEPHFASLNALPPATPEYFLAPPVQRFEGRPAASEFHYDYVDALFSFGDLTGPLVEGSFYLQERWLAVAKAGFLSDSDVDLTTVSAGVGYVYPLQRQLDLVGTAELEYGDLEVDGPFGKATDDEFGFRGRGGARYQLTDEVELFGGLGVRTIFDNDLRADGGARYRLNERIALMGRLEVDDNTQVSLGARFEF